MPFRAILETLVARHAPAIDGAIFCDGEGERVDAFAPAGSMLDAYQLDLWGAAYAHVAGALAPGSCMRVAHIPPRVVWVATVEGGYYLLVVCRPAVDGVVRPDLPRAVAALAAHM